MDDNTIDNDLNQIRERQLAIIDDIDTVKGRLDPGGQARRDIERIQNDAMAIIMEIDEIRKRREDVHHQTRPVGAGPDRSPLFF